MAIAINQSEATYTNNPNPSAPTLEDIQTESRDFSSFNQPFFLIITSLTYFVLKILSFGIFKNFYILINIFTFAFLTGIVICCAFKTNMHKYSLIERFNQLIQWTIKINMLKNLIFILGILLISFASSLTEGKIEMTLFTNPKMLILCLMLENLFFAFIFEIFEYYFKVSHPTVNKLRQFGCSTVELFLKSSFMFLIIFFCTRLSLDHSVLILLTSILYIPSLILTKLKYNFDNN